MTRLWGSWRIPMKESKYYKLLFNIFFCLYVLWLKEVAKQFGTSCLSKVSVKCCYFLIFAKSKYHLYFDHCIRQTIRAQVSSISNGDHYVTQHIEMDQFQWVRGSKWINLGAKCLKSDILFSQDTVISLMIYLVTLFWVKITTRNKNKQNIYRV